jgi:lipopolysaccharide export system permease protein
MGKTLRRYLLREVVSLLFLGLVLTTFVLASVQMVDLVDLALAKGVALWRVATVFGYMIPSYLELTLPMAFLLSIVATFARLARGGEVLAMRAAGVSFTQLTTPVVGLAVAVSALSFGVAAWASPWANRGLDRAITDMARTRISAALTPGGFSPWVEDIVVYVGTINRRTGDVTEVMVADERDLEHPRTILAARGNLTTDDDAKMARLRMYEGTILSEYAIPRSYDRTVFDSFELNVSFGTESDEKRSGYLEEPRRMSWQTLLDSRTSVDADGAKAQAREVEIQRRMVVPFSCVLMPWLGVGLGVKQSQAARSRGVVVGLLAILVYYFLVTAGMTLVHQEVLSAPVALWAPNVLLLVAAIVAFRGAAERRVKRRRR